MPTSPATSQELAQAGLEAGRSMLAAIEGKSLGTPVSIDAGDFKHIATLLVTLARSAARCGGDDCFARPVNGVRAWVPIEEHERRVRECANTGRELARLREALSVIAGQTDERPARLFRRPAVTAASIARDALGG